MRSFLTKYIKGIAIITLTCALVVGGWYVFLLVDGKSLISDGVEENQVYDQFRTELVRTNELLREFNESEQTRADVPVLLQAYAHFKQVGVHLDQFYSYFSYRLTDTYVLHEIQYQGEDKIFNITVNYIMGRGKESDILYLMEYSSLLLDVFPIEYMKDDRTDFFINLMT
ncbi:hypothetical protein [Paenibacillus gallinarum]|uniref:Two-component sensor histidine kinase n=1 Tax=Paenibacillus gallinarum TaxID=2762232 RepID=A0ABR8SZ80_9BACL|nr:hypothetical protein [Paenibacillus gallinarum]MBD7968821.1 hypothetical protein [Paenibacillus gallinarum]